LIIDIGGELGGVGERGGNNRFRNNNKFRGDDSGSGSKISGEDGNKIIGETRNIDFAANLAVFLFYLCP
jgi:hypothetical protein